MQKWVMEVKDRRHAVTYGLPLRSLGAASR